MTQAETNADLVLLSPVSATADITLEPVFIYTVTANSVIPLEASVDQANSDAVLAAVSGTASGSATINTVADSGTLNTGTGDPVSDGYLETHSLDGSEWVITPAAGAMQVTLTFNVGTTGVPNNITLDGRLHDPAPTTPDILDVEVFNYTTSTWNGVGVVTGVNSTSNQVHPFSLTDQQVDRVTVPGEVSIRFTNQAGFSANSLFYIDRMLCGYAVVASTVGYANGMIWIDTINGVSGQIKDINGVADNPVDNSTDALAISIATNLREFHLAIGSTLTLIGDATGMSAFGQLWSIELEEQIITAAHVTGAHIDGISGAGSFNTEYIQCNLNTCSLTPFEASQCRLSSNLTLLTTGSTPTYTLDNCYSAIAGTNTPSIDFGIAGTAKALNMRHYSGGIEIENMQDGDTMSLEGDGQLVLNANCDGGIIAVRGNFTVTDNSGNVTLSDDARFAAKSQIDNIEDGTLPDEVFDPAAGTVTYLKKGTLTQVSKKDLKDPDGNAVDSTEDIIAEATEQ
jgi:hypothetical protein